MIIATLQTPLTLALDFEFSASTNAILKTIGAEFKPRGKFWTLPISRLDKLIAKFGDTLTCDTEVWLAASPKLPAQVRAENEAWANGAPQPVTPVTMRPLPAVTRLDEFLIDGLPRWAANAEREKAMQRQRRY